MEKTSAYSSMMNMRKLTMFNPAALVRPTSGDIWGGKDSNSVKPERRHRDDRRSSDRRGTEP